MNYSGIVLGVIFNFILARIWYGFIFKDSWRRLTGRSADEKALKEQMFIAIILAVFMSFGVNILMNVFGNGVISYMQALQVGLGLGIFFLIPVVIGEWIWDKKPLALVVMNAGFYSLYFIITLFI